MVELNNETPENSNQQTASTQNTLVQTGYPQSSVVQLTPAQKSARNMGIAGMVLGIVAIVFCWFVFIALPCGVVGLILSIISIKKSQNGMAIAGLICSIFALVIMILIIIIAVATMSYFTHSIFNTIEMY